MFFGEKISRWLQSKGYGVQSPAAFRFVTGTLAETLPYYIYPRLDSIVKCSGEKSPEHFRRLFRVVNHVAPKSIVAYAPNSAAAAAIAAARPSVPCHIFCEGEVLNSDAARFVAETSAIVEVGASPDAVQRCIANGGVGLLYVGVSQNAPSIVENALNYVDDRSVIIVEGINRNRAWWKGMTAHPRVVVTFDIGAWGVLFFDTNYKKQNFRLNFK